MDTTSSSDPPRTSSENIQQLSWAEVLLLLSQHKKCALKALDTIVVGTATATNTADNHDGDNISWYFTNKSGILSKKKKENSSIAAVVDRFSRFALSNPFNGSGFTGVVADSNGKRSVLTHPQLLQYSQQRWSQLQLPGCFLQVYLRPHRGEDAYIIAHCNLSNSNSGINSDDYSFEYSSEQLFETFTSSSSSSSESPIKRGSNPDLSSQQIQQQIRISAGAIFSQLRQQQLRVQQATVEFIVDDNQHAWLSCISHCAVTPLQTAEAVSVTTDASTDTATTATATITAAAAGGSPSTKEIAATATLVKSPPRQQQQQQPQQEVKEVVIAAETEASAAVAQRKTAASKLAVKKDILERKKLRNKSPPPSAATVATTAAAATVATAAIYAMADVDNETAGAGTSAAFSRSKSSSAAAAAAKKQKQQQLAPPSMELLAKFAAERDRHHQLMQQQQEVEDAQQYGMFPLSTATNTNTAVTAATAGSRRGGKKAQLAAAASAAVGKRSTHAGLSLGSQIPRLHNDNSNSSQLEAAERRLEELQKIAATTASIKSFVHLQQQQQQQQQLMLQQQPLGATAAAARNGDNNNISSSSINSSTIKYSQSASALKRPNISGSEADFLVRQIGAADIAQLSLLSDPTEFESVTAGLADSAAADSYHINNSSNNSNSFHSSSGSDTVTAATVSYNAQQQQQQQQQVVVANTMAAAADMSRLLHRSGGSRMQHQQQLQQQQLLTGKSIGELIEEEQLELQKQLFGAHISSNKSNNSQQQQQQQVLDPKFVVTKLSEALKARILSLEEQIAAAAAAAAKKEAELEKKDAKIRRLNSEVEKAKQENAQSLQQQQVAHETEMLRLRETHAKEKSALAIGAPLSIVAAAARNHQLSPGKRSPNRTTAATEATAIAAGDINTATAAVVAVADGNVKLIEQVELLTAQLRKTQDAFASERLQLQRDSSNRLQQQERQFKAELAALRSGNAQLEDNCASISEQLATAQSRIDSLQRVNSQLDAAKQQALQSQQQLRADLKNMQQSVQASYRLEAAQGISANGSSNSSSNSGAVVDAETAIRLNDAKNDAKSRQLLNKLEFLKAQLDAEKKAADEARIAMEQSQRKLEEMRADFKLRMQEADNAKLAAVEEAEQSLDLQYQERMRELTTLQMRLLQLEGQLGSAQEQELLSKQREELAKATAAKAHSQQAQLRMELDQQRQQLLQLRDEKEADMIREAGKQNNEAVIRRLDNERQYLKSQLASEMTHKSELQSELLKSQQQLGDVQQQWKADVSALKDAAVAAKHVADESQQQLTAQLTHTIADRDRISAQQQQLKDGFVKLRDQLRMEQLQLENANSTQRRLQENLEESRGEINRLRQLEQQTAENHQLQVAALNEALQEQQQRSSDEIHHLKAELSSQFMDNSRAHSATLLLRDQFEAEKLQLRKLAGAQKIANGLRRWQLARLHASLRLWQSNSSLVGAARQFRVQVETLLKKNTKDLNTEKQKSLQQQQKELDALHRNEMRDRDAQWEETMCSALTAAEQQTQQQLQQLRKEHAEQQQQLEADFAFDLQQARREGEEEVAKAIARKDKEIEFLQRDHRSSLEMTLEDAQQEKAAALQQKEAEMTQLLHDKLHQQQQSMLAEQQRLLLKNKSEHDAKLQQREQQLGAEMQQLQESLTAAHQTAISALQQRHQEELASLEQHLLQESQQQQDALLAQHEQQQQQLRETMREAEERRINELRAQWTVDADERTAQLKATFKSSLQQYVKDKDAEQARAVEEEADKWEHEVAQLQKQHEFALLKQQQQLAEEMRAESERLTAKFEQLRAEEKQLHDAAVATLKEDHVAAVSRLEEKHKKLTDALRNDFDSKSAAAEAAFNERLQLQLANAELTWRGKLQKEQSRLEQLRNDLAQQSQHHAAERANLQRQVDRADERIKQMEAMGKADMAAAAREFEKERVEWQQQQEEQLKAAQKQHDAELLQCAEGTRAQCAQEQQLLLQQEQARWKSEFDEQMQQLQQENDALIGNFESSIAELQSQQQQLTAQLEAAVSRQQETEDALYDSQQQLKYTQLHASLSVWRSASKMLQMRQRFSDGIAEFDREAAQKYRDIEQSMQKKINTAELVSCQLAALLQQAESDRCSTREVLTSHRTTELLQQRKQIQQMEQQLERLTMEKDSLEEQRELVDVDVSQMEQQVRVLEDQIRTHSQESSVANGRINVAHARKKRRLDSELEHLLESIEQKRGSVAALEKSAAAKAHERDDLELRMIDCERLLVQILMQQQQLVMARLEEAAQLQQQSQQLLQQARIPYPVPQQPTLAFVEQVVAAQRKKTVTAAAGGSSDSSVDW